MLVYLARSLRKEGNADEAKRLLDGQLQENTGCEICFEELLRLHVESRDNVALLELVKTFLSYNPGHRRARSLLPQLEKMVAADTESSNAGDSL